MKHLKSINEIFGLFKKKKKDDDAFKAQKQFQFPEVNRGNLDINDSTFMEMMTNAFGMD